MRFPAADAGPQVIGLVHMTRRDPLERRRQAGSSCSAVVASLSGLRARDETDDEARLS
jgi:hypothetical protein